MQRFADQDELLDGLPVVRVANWSQLTPALLRAEWARIQAEAADGRVSWTKLYLPYWLAQMAAHVRPDLQ